MSVLCLAIGSNFYLRKNQTIYINLKLLASKYGVDYCLVLLWVFMTSLYYEYSGGDLLAPSFVSLLNPPPAVAHSLHHCGSHYTALLNLPLICSHHENVLALRTL